MRDLEDDEFGPWEPVMDERNSIQRRVWALPSGHRAMIQGMREYESPYTGEKKTRGVTHGEEADYFRFWSATEKEPIAESRNLGELEETAAEWLRRY